MSIGISIIIPTYNSSKTIINTVYSCTNQVYDNYEVLIIDDGSTDNTIQLLNKDFSDHKNVKIHSLPHKERSAARNFGIQNSDKEFLLFLDSDDELLPDALANLCNAHNMYIEDNGNEFLVGGCVINNIQIGLRKNFNFDNSSYLSLNELIQKPPFPITCCLVQTSIAKEVLFKENMNKNEDWDFWIRICTLGYNFIIKPDILIFQYNLNPGEQLNEYSKKMYMACITIWETYASYIKSDIVKRKLIEKSFYYCLLTNSKEKSKYKKQLVSHGIEGVFSIVILSFKATLKKILPNKLMLSKSIN